MTNTTQNDQQSANLMTAAYIGFAFREAIADGLEFELEDGGQCSIMERLLESAPLLDAEWQRRYGTDGINPQGACFHYYYEVVEEFGKQFVVMLEKDWFTSPAALIKSLFDEADPEFVEPVPEPAYDLPAIKSALMQNTLTIAINSPTYTREILESGFVPFEVRPEDELVALYRTTFGQEPPMLNIPTSTPDANLQAAA